MVPFEARRNGLIAKVCLMFSVEVICNSICFPLAFTASWPRAKFVAVFLILGQQWHSLLAMWLTVVAWQRFMH